MTTANHLVIPLGASGLWVRFELCGDCIPRIRIDTGPDDSSTTVPDYPTDVDRVVAALSSWPESTREDWVDHPLFPPVGTAFQRRVWRELCRIPPGRHSTYGEIARAVGRPGAGRAVGQAVGANPWPPLVPCHRVLAAGGRLGGYALGVGIKRELLRVEGVETAF